MRDRFKGTRDLINALTGRSVHSYSLRAVADNRLLGIYSTAQAAMAAAAQRPGHVTWLEVWHPAECDCPEAPR